MKIEDNGSGRRFAVKTAVAAAFGLFLFTLSTSAALADKRVALVVGNSSYQRLNRLANPSNDASDIAGALKSVGFDVILRTDVGKGDFDHALAEFARKAQSADAALFYVEFWADKIGMDLPVNCRAHYELMRTRPAVRQVLAEEGYR